MHEGLFQILLVQFEDGAAIQIVVVKRLVR
jgi:hypothetical protein